MAERITRLKILLQDAVTGPSKRVAASMRSMGRAIRETTGRVGIGQRLDAAMGRAEQRMQRYRAGMLDAVAVGYALQRSLAAPINAATQFESSMADVVKVVDALEDAGARKEFEAKLIDLSKRVPLAAQELTKITAAAGQAGIPADELIQWTELVAKVGVAFDMTADTAGTAMAKIRTAFGMNSAEVQLLTDGVNHLSNKMASTAPEIVDVLLRVGKEAEGAGFAAVQVAAIGSAMVAAGAEANVAATSIRNMAKALTFGEAATKGQRNAYKQLGLDAVKVAKDMQENAVKTTRDVFQRINNLPEWQQNAVMTKLFGSEARALKPLIANLALFDQAIAHVADSTRYAGSATDEYNRRAATFENRIQLFQNSMEALKISIGTALIPILTDLVNKIQPIIDKVTAWVSKNQELVGKIIAITSAIVGLRVGLAALKFAFGWLHLGALQAISGGLSMLTGAFTGLKLALVGTGIGLAIAAIVAGLIWIKNNWEGLTTAFEGFKQGFSNMISPEAKEALTSVVEWLQPVIDAINNLLGPLSATNEEWRQWGTAVGEAAAAGINGFVSAIETVIGWLQKAYDIAVKAKNAVANFFGAGETAPSQMSGAARKAARHGKRASGGPVMRGKSYLVGEEGPEIFQPGRLGTIKPTDSAQGRSGPTTVNIPVTLNYAGSGDPAELLEAVRKVMREEVREAMRGSLSDTGIRFA